MRIWICLAWLIVLFVAMIQLPAQRSCSTFLLNVPAQLQLDSQLPAWATMSGDIRLTPFYEVVVVKQNETKQNKTSSNNFLCHSSATRLPCAFSAAIVYYNLHEFISLCVWLALALPSGGRCEGQSGEVRGRYQCQLVELGSSIK